MGLLVFRESFNTPQYFRAISLKHLEEASDFRR